MTNKGWVKLHREQFDHWVSKKPFCDGYAWCYLYANANHKKGVVNFRNEYVEVERGQVLKSKLQLQEYFKWTYRHVENFLKALEKDQMITYRVSNRYTLITILNYDKYQGKNDESVEQNDEQVKNRLGTGLEQGNTNKNVKNVKNVKKSKRDDTPYPEIVELYNAICGETDMPKASKQFLDGRKKLIRNCYNEIIHFKIKEVEQGMDSFVRLFTMAAESDFLTGRIKGKDWKANFSWLMEQKHYYDVLENKYTNRERD